MSICKGKDNFLCRSHIFVCFQFVLSGLVRISSY